MKETPIVMFDRVTDKINCDKVIIDDFDAIYNEVKSLKDLGRKKIGFITTINDLNVGKYRANDTDTTAAGGGAPFIYTGFRPAFIMIKRLSGANSWCMYDDRRGGNDENPYVEADSTVAEQTNGEINICSNGFKLDDSGTEINYSTNEYVYWAIARHPFVSSKGVPTTAGTGNIVDIG